MGKKGDNEKLPEQHPQEFKFFIEESGIRQRLSEGGRINFSDLITMWDYFFKFLNKK